MFFSVKQSVKILGKVYTPCVCYALPEILVPTIEKLVKDEKAYIYGHKVYFQSGKVLEKKSAVKENVAVEKPKKEKKAKEAPVKDVKGLAEEAEITPSSEETIDNGDF